MQIMQSHIRSTSFCAVVAVVVVVFLKYSLLSTMFLVANIPCFHFLVCLYVCLVQSSWTFYIQVMTYEQAEKFRWNPFVLTKVR